MRTIYIDDDFKCHACNDGTMMEIETDFFDGKCDSFISGYRLVPEGSTWIRDDGVAFSNMITPWMPFKMLSGIQQEYEKMRSQFEDMHKALDCLGVDA